MIADLGRLFRAQVPPGVWHRLPALKAKPTTHGFVGHAELGCQLLGGEKVWHALSVAITSMRSTDEADWKVFLRVRACRLVVARSVPIHDRRAESKVIKAEYGTIADLLVAHGYGPDHPDGGGPRT